MRMVTAAASGHPGGSLSSTDILTYLFFKEMNVTPETWRRSGEGLDQFFLSAGHISPVLYSLLARRGYFPVAELATFRRFGTRLQGHPREHRKPRQTAGSTYPQPQPPCRMPWGIPSTLVKCFFSGSVKIFCLRVRARVLRSFAQQKRRVHNGCALCSRGLYLFT